MCIVTANTNLMQHSDMYQRHIEMRNTFPATKCPLPAKYLKKYL